MSIQRQAVLLSFIATLVVGFFLGRMLIGIHYEKPTIPSEAPDALYQEYEAMLEQYATSRGIDYDKLSKDLIYERVYGFFAYQGPDHSPELFPTDADKLVYDINAYNALMRIAISRHWPLDSPFDIAGPVELTPGFGIFQGRRFRLDGQKITLIALDKRIRTNPAYDPRVSLVLACGARSCAYVQSPAFRANTLDEQLDQVVRRTLAEARAIEIDKEERKILILPVFFLYQDAIEDWLATQTPAQDFESWLLSMTPDPDALHALIDEGYHIESQEMNWEIDRAE